MSGFATKKFAGTPAFLALFRNVSNPRNPFPRVAVVQAGALLHMNPNGFGFIAAR